MRFQVLTWHWSREWEQVKAEMIVGRKKRVETLLHFLKIADVDPLVDVEPRDPLDGHLKNDSDGADAPDRRLEQIVGSDRTQ